MKRRRSSKSSARKGAPTLFDLYAAQVRQGSARRNPLVPCEQSTTSRNKYPRRGAEFRYAGGRIKVEGCDTLRIPAPKTKNRKLREKGRSAYNVKALEDLPRRGISKGESFPLAKSRVASLRHNNMGQKRKQIFAPQGRYSLEHFKGGKGIFGVEGFSRKTKRGQEGHTWDAYKSNSSVMARSAEIIQRFKKQRTKAGKLRVAKELPKAAAVQKQVVRDLIAENIPAGMAKEVAKPLLLAAAQTKAPGAHVKEVASQVVADMGREIVRAAQDFKAAASPSKKKAVAAKLGNEITRQVKQDIAPAASAASKRLARKPKSGSSELGKAVANPFRFPQRIKVIGGRKPSRRSR